MTIQVGDKIPAGKFKTQTAEGIQEITTDQLFAGKKVVLFSVPGAFTPTCNDAHLPTFQVREDELRAKGIDTIACVAVNDVFVMSAWAAARNVGESITMLADGSGDFARATGLELDLNHFGMGVRSKRYAAVIEDAVVRYLGVEPAGDVGVSGAEAVLAAL